MELEQVMLGLVGCEGVGQSTWSHFDACCCKAMFSFTWNQNWINALNLYTEVDIVNTTIQIFVKIIVYHKEFMASNVAR